MGHGVFAGIDHIYVLKTGRGGGRSGRWRTKKLFLYGTIALAASSSYVG
jgi:hypothetical protein